MKTIKYPKRTDTCTDQIIMVGIAGIIFFAGLFGLIYMVLREL